MLTKDHKNHLVVVHRKEKSNGESETFFGISTDAVPIVKEVVKWGAILFASGVLLACGLAPEKVADFVLHLWVR